MRTLATEQPDLALTIGELASQAGVTAETIRFYEREGVIPRAARRGTGKYRLYGMADADRLRFIRRARDLGFTLDEVRELLVLAGGDPSQPCGDVNTMARAHLARVEAKIAQLTAMRVELSRLFHECDRDKAIAECALLESLAGSAGT